MGMVRILRNDSAARPYSTTFGARVTSTNPRRYEKLQSPTFVFNRKFVSIKRNIGPFGKPNIFDMFA